ncbi:MAG: CheY-like chemotaxis protein [Planctomycetota bacterium]|jgi:CheY-like chemotaxis protein
MLTAWLCCPQWRWTDRTSFERAKPYQAPEGTLILVAEDNSVNQRVSESFLKKLGATVLLANNGRKAMEQWRDLSPSLALMDLQMPEMDGLDATREIRKLEQDDLDDLGDSTPIVALTANVSEEVRQRCSQAGMDGHLSRPFQLRELSEVIQRCLEDRGPNQARRAA